MSGVEWEFPSNDQLVSEEPLEMRLNGEALAVTMRTPGDDFELVRGFLYTEQIVNRPEEILGLERPGNGAKESHTNVVSATVPPKILEGKCWLRNFYASSSCGVCGKASIEQLRLTRPIIESSFRVGVERLYQVVGRMRKLQALFNQTGGLHAAALFNERGEVVVVREDVGRHNAVDKVVGWAMESYQVPVRDLGLFVSGRSSFEIVQKAIAAGIPFVGAISAPSSLAVSLAKEYRVTLAGFVRGETCSVYSEPDRIQSNET